MARPQRLTREESRAQTRERLLEAARQAFARGGYGGASVDVIAADAGYTKGAFYGNFESKEAIFLELLARHKAAEAEQLDGLVSDGEDLETVLAKLDAWLAGMNADADWALLAMELELHARRSPSFAAAYDAINAGHQKRLGVLVERLFTLSGKRLPAPGVDLAVALMALAHGLVLNRPGQKEPAASPGSLIGIVLRSLIAAAPEQRAT